MFRSSLFGSHTLATSLGYAAFAYSMILGLMYLHLFRELKAKDLRRTYDRLPPGAAGAHEPGDLIAAPLLTVGILLGSILVKVSAAFATDPKIRSPGCSGCCTWRERSCAACFAGAGEAELLQRVRFAAAVVFMVTVRLLLPTLHRF